MNRARRSIVVATLVSLAATVFVSVARAAKDDACTWLAGDLHIHTTYSHDSYGGPTDDNTGPDEFYTLGHSVTSQFAVAASRGLDYLAITDHNDIRSQGDPGYGSFGVTPVGGYENSLNGHAQMLGAHEIYDNRDGSAQDVDWIAQQLRVDGGVFQINHPAEGSTDFPNDADWGYGNDVVPDTVEVWNISRLWQPPMPSGSSNDDAVRYWEGWLDRGYRVGATGGSDNHYLATTAVQGAGQPTTWVCAPENSEAGILAGLRSGHTFISHQPPAFEGPRVFLEADGDGNDDYEAIVGDSVPPGSAARVRVVGAPGSLLRIVTNGGRQAFDPITVDSADFSYSFSLPTTSTWVRAEIFEPDGAGERAALCDDQVGSNTTYCRNQLLVLGMTSALYFGGPPGPPFGTP